MADLGLAFDSKKYDDMANFEPVPLGEYLAQVTKSDVKATKDKKGKYISLEFTILSGQYKGRKVFTNLNVVNQNPVAVEIAQKALATLCRAVRKPMIKNTQELHAIPFLLKVKIKLDSKNIHPPKNEPTGFRAVEAAGGSQEPGFINGDAPSETPEEMKSTAQDTTELSGADSDEPPWGADG